MPNVVPIMTPNLKRPNCFQMVQNMMHWAVTHQTAAEIVYSRADTKMPHMGLTTWKNAPDGRVQKSDTIVAKTTCPTRKPLP